MCGCKISFWVFLYQLKFLMSLSFMVLWLASNKNVTSEEITSIYSTLQKESTTGRNYLEKRNIQQLQKNHVGLKLLNRGDSPRRTCEGKELLQKIRSAFPATCWLSLQKQHVSQSAKEKVEDLFLPIIFYYISISEEELFCSLWDLFIVFVEFSKKCWLVLYTTRLQSCI